MKKLVVGLMAAVLLFLSQPNVAQAAPAPFDYMRSSQPTCERATPVVTFSLTKTAAQVGFARPNSDDIYWLDTDVPAGTHKYALPKQAYGSTQQWVFVANFAHDRDDLYGTSILEFKRPAKSKCVNVRHKLTVGAKVNQTCPKGSVKVIAVRSSSKKGHFSGVGFTQLKLADGTVLRERNTRLVGTKRKLETFFFVDRKATLKPANAGVTKLVLSSKKAIVMTHVVKDCLEAFDEH